MMHRKDIKPNHLWFVRQSPDKLSEDPYIHNCNLSRPDSVDNTKARLMLELYTSDYNLHFLS